MGFIKARESNRHRKEKGDDLLIVSIHPAAFRETALARAACARAKSDPGHDVAAVDGEALRDLAATVDADARLVRVPVKYPPCTPTA